MPSGIAVSGIATATPSPWRIVSGRVWGYRRDQDMSHFARALLGCATVIAAVAALSAMPQQQLGVRIEISQNRDIERVMVDRVGIVDFVGTVVNGSRSPITLEAYRLPGGYMGAGLVFECGEVEQWNVETQEWPPPELRPIHPDQIGSTERYTLAPGASRATCSRAFIPVAGAPPARFRFRLWRTFRRDGQSWTSEEFVTELRPVK